MSLIAYRWDELVIQVIVKLGMKAFDVFVGRDDLDRYMR